VPASLQLLTAVAGRVGIAFLVTFIGWAFLALAGVAPSLRGVLAAGAWFTGAWLLVRWLRRAAEKAIWRLRHRLIITYLFIAVAPVVLLIVLALVGGYSLLLQFAMNKVISELDHRAAELAGLAEAITQLNPDARIRNLPAMLEPYFTVRYPELVVRVGQRGREYSFPAGAAAPPFAGASPAHGVLRRGQQYFLWAQYASADSKVTLAAPLSRPVLDQLAPELGLVEAATDLEVRFEPGAGSQARLPPALHRLDVPFFWFATLPAAEWDQPNGPTRPLIIALETRASAVIASAFNRRADIAQGVIQWILIAGAIVFVVVELICWVIGVRMTRTITGAVHHLYVGTQRVLQGDFSHRMPIAGADQLAELGRSFNRMTAHLEQLVLVAQEQERLQTELEIAREVQNQLYPRLETRSDHLRIAAVCRPARHVSGDYFDYERVRDGEVALAIGDVSGKGISAALLMASLQSSLRTQLRSAEDNGFSATPASIVQLMNRHLCASSTPDKYATFFLGIYNEPTSTLAYANAGHLPPVLVRGGRVQRLEVTGTIVGAFPSATFAEQSIRLEPGDLLVAFTDGCTEPESEFGELFGEDRLMDLIVKNAHLGEQQVLETLLGALRQWTASEALQDDITLLIARRV
jgi:sigma-B regulation protein RsbU (phosphoserine phosphatase)